MNKNPTSLFLGGVQHFSLFEGEGIRTSFYLKGCPMRCAWCCNPELHKTQHDLMYIAHKCIGINKCSKCIDACPSEAIYPNKDNTIGIDRELCTLCGKCFTACPAQALLAIGKSHTVEECMKIVNKDRDFIDGVTISGGEPFMRPQATMLFVEALAKEGIPIAISTSGFFDLDNPFVIKILETINTLYFDIKHVDAIKHKNATGLDNTRILSNFVNLLKKFPKLECISQTVIIPGFNDDTISMNELALFLSQNSLHEHTLHFYHSTGEEKYTQLGRPCLYTENKSVKKMCLEECKEIFSNYSIKLIFK